MNLTKGGKSDGVVDTASVQASAKNMIRIYGSEAQKEAEHMRARMVSHGRVDGEIVWGLIADEIKRTQK